MLACLVATFSFYSCEEDTEPRYQVATEFELNASPYQDALIELENTENIEITCSQPNYGYAAPAVYQVQVSLDDNWDAEDGFNAEAQTLSAKSTLCRMSVSANDLAVMICQLSGVVDASDVKSEPMAVYMRVISSIPGIEDSQICSNSIKFSKVVPYYALPDVELPEAMFMVGKFCGWDWSNGAEMVAVYDNPDLFWTIRYVNAGEGFKFNYKKAWDGNEMGFDKVTVKSSIVTAAADNDGNITVDKSGWYIFAVKTTIVGREYETEVQVMAPNVYVYGPANGGAWNNTEEWKFEVIDDPNAEWPFVSPTVKSTVGTEEAGCLRLCIHPDEWDGKIDWWKTEFIFFEGKISYRADGGDQPRVGNPEGKVYLNFVTGKAKVE